MLCQALPVLFILNQLYTAGSEVGQINELGCNTGDYQLLHLSPDAEEVFTNFVLLNTDTTVHGTILQHVFCVQVQ